MKKLFISIVILALAGVAGVCLGTTKAAEYVRNPFYRDALAIEREFPFIDVVGFSSKNGEVSIGIVFLENFEDEGEGDRLTRWLNYVAQRRSTPQTKVFSVWVLATKDGFFFANGLWQVGGDDLRSDGVTNETMKGNETVYFRWLQGVPFRFKEGVWPWAGR